MQQMTMTFDRVFDVVKNGSRQRATLFSFASGDAKEYGVLVIGNPRLYDGMTVTVVLKEPGNWQTLMCWRNHQTGEIVFGGGQSPGMHILQVTLLGGAATAMLHAISRQSPWLAVCGAVALLAYVAGEVRTIRELLGAHAQLKQASASMLDDGDSS